MGSRKRASPICLSPDVTRSGFLCAGTPGCYVRHPPVPNRYFIEGEQRADGVRDLFAAIAPRYDLINDLQSFGLHRRWKRRLVHEARITPGEQALDLCCGTGDVAFALARAGAEVTGVDFSEPMLAIARGRAAGCEASRGIAPLSAIRMPRFEHGDALALRFADRSFQLVTIAYGLRNLASIAGGLAEMARVSEPGGRILILDISRPGNRWWRSVYLLHLKTVVPLLGRLFCGDAQSHAYILESLNRYPSAPQIAELMQAAGWKSTRWINLLGGVMTLHSGRRDV
jgi:demethylmenaquinone methyltransferase/2-methoxy-6-polyprenyl-1,4-benzoquinol methylase